MASFDPKSLRERRRNKLRKPEELRQLTPGRLGGLDVSRLVLSEIPASLALRVSLALMLRVLGAAGKLTGLDREALRTKIVELVAELAETQAARPEAPPAQEALPSK
ncbi:MAG TPA: hypothetical protein VFB36_00530 [Nevskiaceae bacterium]|nr:hypothetical protein [Nevskiaceae bacterium]